MSLTCNSLDLRMFCYHTFIISQTLWLSCQQSYQLKYVKSHNPQVFDSHCCPKHCENGIPSSERLPGYQVIACLVPLFPICLYEEKVNLEFIILRHRLTSLRHLQVNQASAGTKQGPQLPWGWRMSLLWPRMIPLLRHRKNLVWGEQSFPNLEGIIQLWTEQRHWWDTELYWQNYKIHFLFLFRGFLHHLKT